MRYISKGIVEAPSTEHHLQVSRCGGTVELSGLEAALWLDGRLEINETMDARCIAALRHMERMGLVQTTDLSGGAGAYDLLTGCIIFPAKRKLFRPTLNIKERRTLKWITRAGIRLCIEELVYLADQRVSPAAVLLGMANRQALVEVLYDPETIGDGLLRTLMERSPAVPAATQAVLGLLRKRRLILV